MAFISAIPDGGDILLYIDDDLIACATSHSIEISNSTRDTSCKGSGVWGSSEYGRFTWTASCDALFNPYTGGTDTISLSGIFDAMEARSFVTIKSEYDDGNGNTFTLSGQAIISNISHSAGDAENASYSISLEGRGALTKTVVEV